MRNIKELTDEQLEAEHQRTLYTRDTTPSDEGYSQEDRDWCRYIEVTRERERRTR